MCLWAELVFRWLSRHLNTVCEGAGAAPVGVGRVGGDRSQTPRHPMRPPRAALPEANSHPRAARRGRRSSPLRSALDTRTEIERAAPRPADAVVRRPVRRAGPSRLASLVSVASVRLLSALWSLTRPVVRSADRIRRVCVCRCPSLSIDRRFYYSLQILCVCVCVCRCPSLSIDRRFYISDYVAHKLYGTSDTFLSVVSGMVYYTDGAAPARADRRGRVALARGAHATGARGHRNQIRRGGYM